MSYFVLSFQGTPLYMAPELIEEKPYDLAADLGLTQLNAVGEIMLHFSEITQTFSVCWKPDTDGMLLQERLSQKRANEEIKQFLFLTKVQKRVTSVKFPVHGFLFNRPAQRQVPHLQVRCTLMSINVKCTFSLMEK